MSVTFSVRYEAGDFDREDFSSWPSMNVSNSNAGMLLRSLGFEFDYSGSLTPTDLLIAIACADPIDTGAKALIEKIKGGPTMIECEIRPGYHAEKYDLLKEIAHFAHEMGRDVQWA